MVPSGPGREDTPQGMVCLEAFKNVRTVCSVDACCVITQISVHVSGRYASAKTYVGKYAMHNYKDIPSTFTCVPCPVFWLDDNTVMIDHNLRRDAGVQGPAVKVLPLPDD